MTEAVDLNIDEQILPSYKSAFFDENRFLVLKGGAGSGKSHFIARKILTRCISEGGHRFLIARKVGDTLRKSCYQLFLTILSDWNMMKKVTVNKTEMRFSIISLDGSTSEIILVGVDDVEKLKSVEGITGVWLEEATEFEEGDLSQINLRLRGNTSFYKQICISFNPVSEKHWLKKRFFDSTYEDVTVVETTYLDNSFLDQEYIDQLLQLKVVNPDHYKVYCLNEWGTIQTGQEFVHSFKRSKHVTKIERDPSNWIWITHDFNNLPYMTALMVEVRDKTIRVTGEVCLPPPYNATDDVVDELNRRILPTDTYINLTGDPSGNSSSHRKGRNDARNLFDGIESRWREHGIGVQNHVPRSAVRINDAQKNPLRYMALNRLCSGWRGYTLIVDESCKNTIHDFEVLQNDGNGGFVKPKVKNKQTGQTFEDAGHCMDALIYCLQQNCSELFNPKTT